MKSLRKDDMEFRKETFGYKAEKAARKKGERFMEQVTVNRIWRAQILLLLAAFLLFLGGCGKEEDAKNMSGMAISMSGGVDIENFGSEAWSGGDIETGQGSQDGTGSSSGGAGNNGAPVTLSGETETVPYAGDSFMKTAAAIGADSIYIAGFHGWNSTGETSMEDYFVGRMEVGGDTITEFDLGLPEDMYVVQGCVDAEGRWHMLLTQRIDGKLTWEKSEIWIVNSEGEAESTIDVTKPIKLGKVPFWMSVDAQGNYYFANQGKLVIADSEGKLVNSYATTSLMGVGIGKSGQIYAVLGDGDEAYLGKVDAVTGTIEECASIEATLQSSFSILQAGINTELVLANKGNGAFTYDGDKVKLAVSTASIIGNGQDIGAMGFLEDGRICVMGYEDEKCIFYYVPVEQ